MAGVLAAADEECTVAVVTSRPFLRRHAAVGGLRLAAWAEEEEAGPRLLPHP